MRAASCLVIFCSKPPLGYVSNDENEILAFGNDASFCSRFFVTVGAYLTNARPLFSLGFENYIIIKMIFFQLNIKLSVYQRFPRLPNPIQTKLPRS